LDGRQQGQSKSLDQERQNKVSDQAIIHAEKLIAATISDTSFKTYVAVQEQPLRAIE
jgi:hypothetical protein